MRLLWGIGEGLLWSAAAEESPGGLEGGLTEARKVVLMKLIRESFVAFVRRLFLDLYNWCFSVSYVFIACCFFILP